MAETETGLKNFAQSRKRKRTFRPNQSYCLYLAMTGFRGHSTQRPGSAPTPPGLLTPTRKDRAVDTQELPPLAFLRERFSYDPLEGVVRWKTRPLSHFATDAVGKTWNTRYAGTPGTKEPRGYCFRVEYGGRSLHLRAHRIAYALANGTTHFGEVDHENVDPFDNKAKNLRLATRSQNNANRKGFTKTGLPKGVTKVGSKYAAYASAGRGKTQYLGRHDTPEAAHAAYCAFAKTRHGNFFQPRDKHAETVSSVS